MGVCTSSANRNFREEAGGAQHPQKHHQPLSNLQLRRPKRRKLSKHHKRWENGHSVSTDPPPPPPPLPVHEQVELQLDAVQDHDVANPPLDSGFIMLSDVSSFYRGDDMLSPLAMPPQKSVTATPRIDSDAAINRHVLLTRPKKSALSDIDHTDLDFTVDAKPNQDDTDTDLDEANQEEDDDDEEEEEEEDECDEAHDAELPSVFTPPQYEMTVGDEVQLIGTYNSLRGSIKFIGRVHSKSDGDVFYGLQLHRPRQSDDIVFWVNQCRRHNRMMRVGDDGCIDGVEYFECTHGEQALFVKRAQIAKVVRVHYEHPRIAIDARIWLATHACFGRVCYIGKPHDDELNLQHDIYYGIELEAANTSGDAVANDGSFHGHKYFECAPGFGALLTATDLSEYMVPSRFNLLCHGYLCVAPYANMNIAAGIVALIESYTHLVELRLTEHPEANGEICRKYQAFDVNHNICGPSIIVRKCGSHTQRKQWQTLISGHYQFFKQSAIDIGDRHIQWVNKTEYEITKLDNGDTERIFRSIDTDNEIPLFKDYKSIRQQFRRDIHFNDVDNCDQKQVFCDICNLYGFSRREMMEQLNQYHIRLYGLNKKHCLNT